MAAAIIPLLMIGTASYAGTKLANAGKNNATGTPTVDTSKADAQAKAASEQASGEKSPKQAAAFLKDRKAQGFGPNPNKAKPFLLSL